MTKRSPFRICCPTCRFGLLETSEENLEVFWLWVNLSQHPWRI